MPTLLHVGCGMLRKADTTPGFNTDAWAEIRLDIDPSVAPDITGALTDMSAVQTGSMDALYSSHSIEHLYPFEIPAALDEFLRVLKPDGFAVITCPDLQSISALVAADRLTEPAYMSAAGPITPLDMLYGHLASLAQGNLYMAHRSGFTQKLLHGSLQRAGFRSVASQARPEAFALWALASKSELPEESLRQLAGTYFG